MTGYSGNRSGAGVKLKQPFVGREAIVRDVVRVVSGAEPLVVFLVNGVGGVGKSALLAELARRFAASDARVLHAQFSEVFSGRGAPEDDELLTAYRDILEALAPQLDRTRARQFCQQARETAAGATTRAAANVARDNIRDAFTELVGEGEAALVVLADDVSGVAEGSLGKWLVDLLRHMARRTRVIAVLTRSGSVPEGIEYPGRVVTVRLGALEPGEAEAFLAESGADRRWLDAIERWCGYYPAAVVLGAKLAAEYRDRPEVLDDAATGGSRGRDLVDTLMASLHDEAEQRMIEVAAVVRRFDADLLRSVLSVSDVVAPPGLEQWLAELPFVEITAEGTYRVRPFLRTLLPLRLCSQRPRATDHVGTRLDEVHDLVTEHYAQRVLRDARARSYRSCLTIEDRAHQEEQLEFLHHALMLRGDRRRGQFSLVLAYFDAFWWWGAYVESDFCRRLLDAAEREVSPDDRPLVDALRMFEAAYPPEATGATCDWTKVVTAIETIREAVGIAGTVFKGREAHLRAILEVFLGQAYAALDRDTTRADASLDDAYKTLQQNPDDRWCLPWVRAHQSSVSLACGRDGEALERARAGLQLATTDVEDKDRDYEVEAELHRTIADVLWKRGEHWTAFRHLAKALFFAYAFTSIPVLPDKYTQTFYREVTASALDRILDLALQRNDARRACEGFVAFWSPYWKIAGPRPETASIDSLLRTSPRDVAYCVFPAGPSDDDLENNGKYAERVRRVHDALRPSLDEAVKVFADEPIATRLRAALHRPRRERGTDVPAPDVPQDPAEPPDLFEPSDDPIWPDHWRVFPEEWRDLGDDDPPDAEARLVVDRAVDALPPLWREVLQRRDADGWTYDETARRLGVSRAHQTLMLHHSRARIRAALAEHFANPAP